MNDIEFNLLDEPWIRVMDMQCSIREVSLRELLLQAHTFRAFSGELPTQDAAILRVALAVLHAVFSRTDETGDGDPPEDEAEAVQLWKRIWDAGRLPEKPLTDYFEKWHERFWLFHPERPFYQVADMQYGTMYNAAKLNGTILESGNKSNPRLFLTRSREYKTKMSYAEAARWIINLQAFDDSGGKPSSEGKAINGKLPSIGVGWLGQIGLVWVNGETIFETLMYNLVLVNRNEISEHERPIWERSKVPCGERIRIPYPDNLSELYTLQSRRIFLMREDSWVTEYRLLGGDFFDLENKTATFFEPMTAWKAIKDKSQTLYYPQIHAASIQMWRECPSLLSKSKEQNNIPGVILWIQKLISHGYLQFNTLLCLQIAAVEYVPKKSSICNLFSDKLDIHLSLFSDLGVTWRRYIQDEIELCNQAANCLAQFAGKLFLASGGEPPKDNKRNEKQKIDVAKAAAKSQLYFAFDIPFRRWLSSIDVDSDHIGKQQEWRRQAAVIAEKTGREMIDQAGEPAMIGRAVMEKDTKKYYSAPKAWRDYRAAIRKLYQSGGEQAT